MIAQEMTEKKEWRIKSTVQWFMYIGDAQEEEKEGPTRESNPGPLAP